MRFRFIPLMIVFWTIQAACSTAADKVEFNRDIRPILSQKCFECHGPDEASREADLRLDVADERDGPFVDRDGLFVIKPREVKASSLWERVTSDDEDTVMPPKDSHKEPLSVAEKALIKSWIDQGAEYQDFWAFDSPKPQTAPPVGDAEWSKNRIDRFVMARLDLAGLKPQSRADRRTLIRRLTFDLTGLPPTINEIHRFLNDDSANAYENLVDRLLAKPAYGEHMARHWLDLVRFADTNGIHHDHYREMTPYRDWVIRSFNHNLSFDRFIIDQVAGDLHDSPTVDQQIASGFNRLHLVIDRGTAIPAESFTRNVIDRVTAVGTAFMGLTVGCAVCHDHKFDPVTQKDFYQLYAFFNNIDSGPETPGSGVHAPFIRLPNRGQSERMAAIESEIAKLRSAVKNAQDALSSLNRSQAEAKPLESETGSSEAQKTAEDRSDKLKPTAEQQAATEKLKTLEDKLKETQKSKRDLESTFPVTLVMKERREVRPTHVLVRGAYDQLGEEVERGTPSFLPPLKSSGPVKTRMDLARWLTDPEHPLTARVTVNRLWQQFFGVGLVKTSEDFGMQGEWPSHPGLLDDLTNGFVESGWDVKTLVKYIVCSRTYQQSSSARPSEFKADPDNRLLARGSRFRLDAEMIRDQILSVSGLLHATMYGKSVKPPQPPNLWKTVSMVSSSTYAFKADAGEKIHRRSLYSFWKRALPPPQMTIFDAPTREACTARRERTNTPLQALVLMNESQYFRASRNLALKVLGDDTMEDDERIRFVYEAITSHVPDGSEVTTLKNGLKTMRQIYQTEPALGKAMTKDIPNVSEHDRIRIATYTMLINSLFNLDVTKTRE